MRQPTDAMTDAGVARVLQEGAGIIDRDAIFCWWAMIDAALQNDTTVSRETPAGTTI